MYHAEGTRIGEDSRANFGKTYVQFDGMGMTSSQGASLLKYMKNKYVMTTNSAARVSSSKELGFGPTVLGRPSLGDIGDIIGDPSDNIPIEFNMLWYSPRLMAINNTSLGLVGKDDTVH